MAAAREHGGSVRCWCSLPLGSTRRAQSARNLFDGKREMAANANTGDDPFRRLPDHLLHHVLSFLPSDDALQTCVLDTRWRGLWRRETSLRLDFGSDDYGSLIDKRRRFKQVVTLIIQLRGNSPLVKCEVGSYPVRKYADQLITYALTCHVKELIVRSDHTDEEPLHYDLPFISQHLKIVEFYNVDLVNSSLDFSSCPVLEDLTIDRCRVMAPSISSKSLKRLCITGLCTFHLDFRLRIVAPCLVSLQLDGFEGLTPSLGHMPFLVTADVGLSEYCHDFCLWNGPQGCHSGFCGCHAYPMDDGVLLNGLSNAASLVLVAKPKTFFQFIYTWDLKQCPVFNKLKTLLLNEWFSAIDLVCILQHSPILEMLTLQLDNTKNLIRATRAQETIEKSFVCVHLKVVNIECKEVDEGVHKILKILSTCGILRDHISIKVPSSPSDCFSF